jgi:hypothetical protein
MLHILLFLSHVAHAIWELEATVREISCLARDASPSGAVVDEIPASARWM